VFVNSPLKIISLTTIEWVIRTTKNIKVIRHLLIIPFDSSQFDYSHYSSTQGLRLA